MKKILSLILAIAMLLTVIPAVAENGTEEKGGLQSLLNGLGESVAEKIVSVIKSGEAVTVEELRVKASVNKAIMDILVKNNCLGDLPETDQITMF